MADATGRALEAAIRDLLATRAEGATICPSEAARRVARERGSAEEGVWRSLMEPARMAARRLVDQGEVEILQHGRVVDPSNAKGPLRIRLSQQPRQPSQQRSVERADLPEHADGEPVAAQV